MPAIKRYKGYWIICKKARTGSDFVAYAGKRLFSLLFLKRKIIPLDDVLFFSFRNSVEEAIAVVREDIDNE